MKIAKSNVHSVYALTSMQEGMLFYYIKSPGTELYQEQLSIEIAGRLDIELFQRAWQFVVGSNEALRTVFKWEKIKRPVQIVCKDIGFNVCFLDYSKNTGSIGEKKTKALREDRLKTFDIENETFRVSLIKLEYGYYLMIISNHHIIYDGWSTGIIIKEFIKHYNSLLNKAEPSIISKCKFGDFVKWIEEQNLADTRKYWSKYLDGYPGYPVFADKMGIGEGKHENYEIVLPHDLAHDTSAYACKIKLTNAPLFYMACGILLQRLSNSGDVVFGTTVAGRNVGLKGIEEMVGNCINSLPVRMIAKKGDSKLDLLNKLQKEINERELYEWVPLVEINSLCRTNDKKDLFDVLVIIENYPLDIDNLNKQAPFKFKSYSMSESTHYDLTVQIKTFGNIEICFSYNTDKYSGVFIKNIARYFENALRGLVQGQNVLVEDVSILSVEEKFEIIRNLNHTTKEYSKNCTIHDLFVDQVAKTPDKDALWFNKEKISYKELEKKANQLARVLRDNGVCRDKFVGIMVNRSVEMMVSILAIHKSGGAYLPIDPEYPVDRIKYMIEDSKAEIILTNNENIKICNEIGVRNIVNIFGHDCFYRQDTDVSSINSSGDLAYIIYTSGSTGRPKGVMVEHRSVVNFVEGVTSVIDFSTRKSVLALTTISFDIFVLETILPLLNGNTVVIAGEVAQKSVEVLAKNIVENAIDILQVTPSRLRLLLSYDENLDCLRKVKDLLVGGEQFPDDLFQTVKSKFNNNIFNLYGPTEATVWVTIKDLTCSDTVTIGKPIPNVRMFVVNKFDEVQPVGIPGELHVGGDCLARGYYDNETLDKNKFVENKSLNEQRLYKTGDLARILPSGDIDCLGRIDNQVKIRGFRVELEEVEACMLHNGHITDAVVVAKYDKFNVAYLCAYYVGTKNFEYDELKEFLLKDIPDYMIPSYFIKLDMIPLTPNDKIDRIALPEPDISSKEHVAPQSDIEKKLAIIWAEILTIDVEAIGVNIDFFKIGGHSIKATMLLSEIHKEFEVKISVNELFDEPTITGLCKKIATFDNQLYDAVTPASVKNYYPVTSLQKRLYILQKVEKDFTAYNMSGVVTLNDEVNLDKMNAALHQLIQRHEVFRTSFHVINDDIVQQIHNEVANNIEYIDASDDIRRFDKDFIDEVIKSLIKSFDLAIDNLLRLALIKRGDADYVLFVDVHHIIFDGISRQLFINDFFRLYNGKQLPAPKVNYKDYAEWLDREKSNKNYSVSYNFWYDKFKNDIPVLDIIGDFERDVVQNYKGSVIDFVISGEQVFKLKEISSKYGCTLFMTLFSAYVILLSKLSGDNEVVVGVPVSGRDKNEVQDVIGLFVNTLPVLNKIDKNSTCFDFLKNTRQELLDAFDHKYLILEDLLENLNIERDAGRNPLFDVLFVFQEKNDDERAEIMPFEPYDFHNGISKFDLTFEGQIVDNEIKFRVEYASGLFKKETVLRFVGYFKNILIYITENGTVKISGIDVLPQSEKQKILYNFNNTKQSFELIKPISLLFEEAVVKYLDNTAVYDGERKLTYRELNSLANQIAWIIKRKTRDAGSIIGIVADRSIEFLAGILGILKAGCAYLPIDSDSPKFRLDYMLHDSGVGLILVPEMKDYDFLPGYDFLDLKDGCLLKESKENLNLNLNREALAYIIYTSGSTGEPKGVEIEHGSVANLLHTLIQKYPFEKNDRYLLKTPCVFDVSVSELFGWFLGGGSAVVLENGGEKDVSTLLRAISGFKITHLNFVPSMFNLFLETLKPDEVKKLASLKYIFVAGEELKSNSVNKFRRIGTSIALENLYGPTEATVYVSSYSLADWGGGNIPIGKPLSNVEFYILDENNQPQAIGIKGELCISGDCLARGYRGSKKLSSEKFIENPFNTSKRLYKTGDLACWRDDGNIKFLGRKDDQVKIRGYRIEPGEIEKHILSHNDIDNAAVITAKDSGGDYFICAYFISDKSFNELQLRNYLVSRVPSYMVPSYFVKIDSIPLNQNGKLDKKRLPAPDIEKTDDIQLPENKIQEELIMMWAEILGIAKEKIGIHSNFFSIGGHSLKATFLLARISEKFNKEITLADVFKHPTISTLSDLISKCGHEAKNITITPALEREFYPVSFEQKMIFVLQELDKESLVYNMPAMFLIESAIDMDRFVQAFQKVIERHESLRTVFDVKDNIPVQKILQKHKLSFQFDELEENLIGEYYQSFIRSFDLRKLPLLRVGLARVNAEKYYLLIDIHHIVFDGVSINILVNEIFSFYENKEVKELKYQYKDYACWQKTEDARIIYGQQKQYWLSKFGKSQVELNLPIDYPRNKVKKHTGSAVSFEINNELYVKLVQIANSRNVTLNIVLLSTYYTLLTKWCRQEDITIGIPVAGRRNKAFQDIIGMFVNTLALRNKVNNQHSFKELVDVVKVSLLEAYDNQDYPFNELVETLKVNTNTNRNPLFDVAFSYLDTYKDQMNSREVKFKPLPYETRFSRFDLTLFISESYNFLSCSFEYSIEVFNEDTVQLLIKRYIELLVNITDNIECSLNELSFETEVERELSENKIEIDFDF